MTELVGPVAGTAIQHTEREITYLVHFKRNVNDMKTKLKKLQALYADVTQKIGVATNNDEGILEAVKLWQATVEQVVVTVTGLSTEASQINRWFKGWISFARFSIGRRSQKIADRIQNLLEEGNAFGDTVSYHGPVQRELATDSDFQAFGSRVATAEKIIQALKDDDNISFLGVYGMPGVGKTTLIRAIASYMREHRLFNEVVMVTLTQVPDIKLIQDEIAKGLGFEFKADDIPTRASQLRRRLGQDQKTLIVMDNVWQGVELADEVGIPRGHKKCKVVFTTRSQDVCNSMDAERSRIEIEILSFKESWQLFQGKAGVLMDSPDFQSVARNILQECQGLPLLIVTLGRALYGKDKIYWDAALKSLRNSTFLPDPIFTDTPKVFSGMKLSYDSLETEEVKFCFLLCSLFPDGYLISRDQLFHYMMGEKMLMKASTLQEARLLLHVMVDKLISSCLLTRAENGCIMMHDVIRDVAIAIASDPKEGNGFIVKAGVDLNGWPNVQLADCRRLSFITTRANQISWSLPNQIQAVNLLTLSFHGNEGLEKIPASFFEETPNLLAVDLSYTGIKELPQSIMSLGKLHTLLLEGCSCLNDVYLSNTMERLEILNLRYSAVESIMVSPKMTTIKFLDLSYTSKLEHIGENIISRFTKLEELYLFESFRAWEPERNEPGEGSGRASKEKLHGVDSGETERRGDSARLSEVTSLSHLTSLELHVGNVECLFQSIPSWENLRRFKIAVGVIDDFSPFGIDDGLEMEKSMYIELNSRVVANWVKVLLGRTRFLQLSGYQSLIDLLQLDPRSEQRIFQELKVLIMSKIEPRGLSIPSSVENVPSAEKKVQKLSDGVRFTSLVPYEMLVRLQNLNKLVILNCQYFEKLIQFDVEEQAVSMNASSSSNLHMVKFSSVPTSSVFPNLTYLRVCACAELRYLFPMRIIRCLSKLQMLHISDCSRMEMVIVHENAEDLGKAGDEKVILPKLKVLSLEGLESLSLIIEQDVHLELSVLEELTVYDCGRLKKLPFGPGSVPQLTKLAVDDDDWFDELIWDNQNVKQRLLCLLNRLELKGCRSLKDVELHDQWHPILRSVRVTDYEGSTLTPCNFLRKMSHLKNLAIKNSKKLQMIDFGEEDDTVEEEMHSAGPSSSTAKTSKFSKVTTLYPVLANLTCLRVSGCSGLKYLCAARVIGGLLQLEKLYIHDCSGMEMVIKHEDGDKMILPKLRILSLDSLGSLSRIVLKFGHLELPALEELKVKGCEKLRVEILPLSSAPEVRTRLQWDNKKILANQFENELANRLYQVTNQFNVELANRIYLKGCRSLKVMELDDSWHPALVRSLIVSRYEGAILVHSGLLSSPSKLEELMVWDCANLEAVIEIGGEKKAGESSISASSSSSVNKNGLSKFSSSLVFSNLTSLHVVGCDKLSYLLPMAVVRNMAHLKELYVYSCKSMEMIIEYENVEDGAGAKKDKVLLPKLERLTLNSLPQLSIFAGEDILFDWPSLTEIWVTGCPGLKKLPLGAGSVPKLLTCWLDPKKWLSELEWEDEEVKSLVHRILNKPPWW